MTNYPKLLPVLHRQRLLVLASLRPRSWLPDQFSTVQAVTDTFAVDRQRRSFEDYRPGASYQLGSITVDQADIIEFASRYDPQPFHVDPAAAATGPFQGLIASGWHTAALAMRLVVDEYLPAGGSLGGPGLDKLTWPAPVRPGDVLAVQAAVLDARRSASRPDRGIVRTGITAVNQDGALVFDTVVVNFLLAREQPTV